METGVIEITFTDGRIFRIFYANSTQKRKILDMHFKLKVKGLIEDAQSICTGIHTVKEFEKHMANE